MRPAVIVVAAATAALCGVAATQRPPDALPGFLPANARAQLDAERRAAGMASAARLRSAHLFLSGKPHVAGSARDRELADWVHAQFVAYGLEDVRTVEHDALLPWPLEVRVEMTSPRRWQASMREEPVEGDEYSQAPESEIGIPYHAYSASGTATAPVVYAGSGNPADYDALRRRGVDIKGKIALVRYSVPYSYRGFKALTAERRGAAGILIYSDEEDDGAGKGAVYPKGPWGPESHIQRGGIVYDFLVPGDPLTPGWASTPGARRIPREEALSLPRIISAPLSWKDARVILDALGSPHRRTDWTPPASLPVVTMTVRSDDKVRPIWTVTGMIRGRERPDEWVILGNHRDAWIYGGVDPSSGSAALMETARTLGALVRQGWRPSRSIVFASWDAEEFTLTSSTEWGEQFAGVLGEGAVAYLNVDSAASGPHFTAAAVPSLNRLIADVAAVVRDPRTGTPVAAVSRARRDAERGSLSAADETSALVNNRLGSGSDYTVFLNHLGIPVADLSFDGPYGVYHSVYDNHRWVSQIGDPGFRYHVAMTQIWTTLAMRLAAADVLPFDYEEYGRTIEAFVDEVERRGPVNAAFVPLRAAAAAFTRAGGEANARGERALAAHDRAAMDDLNRRLRRVERAWLEPAGIPGRPWYRHLIYAPKFTYAPEVLPGLAEAVEAGDAARVSAQARVLTAALERAAAVLRP